MKNHSHLVCVSVCLYRECKQLFSPENTSFISELNTQKKKKITTIHFIPYERTDWIPMNQLKPDKSSANTVSWAPFT